MKAVWCCATTLALMAGIGLSPAMGQGPKPSGGKNWPGIAQPVEHDADPAHSANPSFKGASPQGTSQRGFVVMPFDPEAAKIKPHYEWQYHYSGRHAHIGRGTGPLSRLPFNLLSPPRPQPHEITKQKSKLAHAPQPNSVVGHCRAPGMEHGGCTDTATQMPRISGDGKQRLGRRAEKQVVYHDLVLVSDRGDLGRHCEDQGEIADRQQIGLAGGKPVPRRRALAFWAMAVATRVVGDPGSDRNPRSARHDRRGRPSGSIADITRS
jgi:hypothetical protein